MINNRQNGVGRRRGRGGQRPPGMSGNSGGGNARDQRQRGNAAQLHEKYKSLARDAQQAGDRVQTEYWLQFADHYFRVLGESRAKFDEQRRARGENVDDDYDDDAEGYDEDGGDDDQPQQRQQQPQRDQQRYQQDGDRYERQDRPQQQDRSHQQDRQQPRGDRYERNDRPDRAQQQDRSLQPDRSERQDRQRAERPQRADNDRPVEQVERQAVRPERSERSERPQRADNDRPARTERPAPRVRRERIKPQDEPRIDFAVIPPAIGVVADPPATEVEQEAAPAPQRRVRRVRPDGEADVAPAV